jgi:hypothetical protein
MTVGRLSVVQWFGFVAAPLAWLAQHIIGLGVTQARCNVAGMRWGIDNTAWQLTLLVVCGLIVIAAEIAAALVFVRTRNVGEDDPPPYGRMHFLSAAAVVANVLFLTVILLDGVASVVDSLCRQS